MITSRLAIPLVLLVLSFPGASLASVGSLEVDPPYPTSEDSVRIRVVGSLPDSCWSFVEQNTIVSLQEIRIDVVTAQKPGPCLFVLGSYGFEAELGKLDPGTYHLTVKDAQNEKSMTFDVRVGVAHGLFARGDANADRVVDLADPIATLDYLFAGQKNIPCEDAADSNDDGGTDIADVIFTLFHLFRGDEQIPNPVPGSCGLDPTEDSLQCSSFPCNLPAAGVYHVFDNGIRCFTWPCPSWTARDSEGDVDFTDLDLSPLALPPEKEQEVRLSIFQGRWRVLGNFEPRPQGPAGTGTTLVVLELVERVGPVGPGPIVR